MNFRFLGVWLFSSKFIYLFAKAASRAGEGPLRPHVEPAFSRRTRGRKTRSFEGERKTF